jgi:pilus assembly protein Flp/PilA
MSPLISKFSRFALDEDGPTAVEYAVMMAFLVLGLIVVIKAMTGSVSQSFSNASSALS